MDAATLKTASGYIAAAFLTTVGLVTIVDPLSRSENFGVPTRRGDKPTLAFIKPMGARDLSLGLTIGMFVFNGDQKNAGSVMLIALVIPAMDAWSVWSYNGRLKEAWPHIIGASMFAAIGVWLIG